MKNKLPPHSLEAEKAVIGGVFVDNEAIAAAMAILSHGDFYDTRHDKIFSAMVDVSEAGSACDMVTVCSRLDELGILAKIGGYVYLAELADSTPSAANIAHHARIVAEKATLRRIVEQAQEIIGMTSVSGVKPSDIPTQLSINVSAGAEINHVSTITKELNRNIERGYPGLPPCYDLLAKTIRKVSPGHLYIVGGYTSVGKSAWLVDFICRMYRHEFHNPGVAIFSTEMSCEQYLVRCLSNQTGIPGWHITENVMAEKQRELLAVAKDHFNSRNLYLYDKLYKIEDIERTARMIKDQKKLDIICIDYLQNLWGDGSIYERMSRLAPVLQYLAKELQVTVIALSQVSNQHVREKGSGVFGFKGAGEIAASADLAIELERDPAIKERMVFKVSKNRHGRVNNGALEYVDGFTRLNEIKEQGADNFGYGE